MHDPKGAIRHALVLLLTAGMLAIGVSASLAQSQEPKPPVAGTPSSGENSSVQSATVTGIVDASWQGPNFGVRLEWDPEVWSVEGELVENRYDGLQIGTPISTVFVEAYDGFEGDADTCLADAEREIGERESVSELQPLTGRPLPGTSAEPGAAQLFGLVATTADGSSFRSVEYVECRTLIPGSTVFELTWQTAASAYNQELPLVESLLATLEIPDLTPSATPVA
jgi:hypothetical protein